MGEFLLEIYSEEIPARMQLSAADQIKHIFEKEAKIHNVGFDSSSSYVTPQRLVLHIKGINEIIKGSEEEVKGPSTSAPEKSIEGFCKANSLNQSDLFVKDIKGKDYYFALKKIEDINTKDIIPEIVLHILHNFQWPKTMRWGSLRERWVRPIRSLLCLFDKEVINLKFAEVQSSNKSFGHRFMSPEAFEVSSIDYYFANLKEKYVILDQDKRKETIIDQTTKLANEKGIVLSEDLSLINEVTGLVEYPKVMLEKISDEFLSLPPEILITSMAVNQKYFSFKYPDGSFAPYFAVIANIQSSDEKVVRLGNRKVLEARLYDAKFFFENDCNRSLESRVGDLKKVHFHAQLGTMYDKTQRIQKIAKFIAELSSADSQDVERSAFLCKADLTSEAVFEFTELQGVMGKYYALNDGEKKEVALAIEEHYWPVSRHGLCPSDITAAIVSIADKIDTITGLFYAGEIPTSSKDPFALRRSVIGIIRIIKEHNIPVNLLKLITYTASLFDASKENIEQVYEFASQRLNQYLKEEGFSQEIISSVNQNADLNDLILRCEDLEKFFNSKDGDIIYSSIKRINNILDSSFEGQPINQNLFASEYEIDLYNMMSKVDEEISLLINKKMYFEALKSFGSLSNCISLFFEKVMINDPDEKVKINRLSLIKQVFDMVAEIANFSQIK